MTAIAGTCSTCGRDLVQADGRTYHPWSTVPIDEPCPDFIPFVGYPTALSSDVPAANFIPTESETTE